MALSKRLEIRQSHALVMRPKLMQAIKLLQLSNLDLATYVEGELERNPLLERIEGEARGTGVRPLPRRRPLPIPPRPIRGKAAQSHIKSKFPISLPTATAARHPTAPAPASP